MTDRQRQKALAEMAHADLESLARRLNDLDSRVMAGESAEQIAPEVQTLNDEQEQAVQRIFDYLGTRRLNDRTTTMLRDLASFDALARQLVERIDAGLAAENVPAVDRNRLHADRQELVEDFARRTGQTPPTFGSDETAP